MIANLFKIEFLKMTQSRSLHILLIFFGISLFIIKLSVGGFNLNNMKPGIIAGILMGINALVLPVIAISLAISDTCYEFSSNMFKQQIMMGISRKNLILSRCISTLMYSILYVLLTIIFFLILIPWGSIGDAPAELSNNPNFSWGEFFIQLILEPIIVIFFILTSAITFSFFFQRTGQAIAAFLGFSFIEFWILYSNPEWIKFSTFSPFYYFSSVPPVGVISPEAFPFWIILFLMIFLQYWIVKKRSF